MARCRSPLSVGCLRRGNVEQRLMKQPGPCACLARVPARRLDPGSPGPAAGVRTWAMRDMSALIVTVDQVAGVATVTVRGEFGPSAYSRLRDRLVWVAENCPQRLVLD